MRLIANTAILVNLKKLNFKTMFQKTSLFIFLLTLFQACQNAPKQANFDVKNANWQQIETQAKGSTVQLMMWQGGRNGGHQLFDFTRSAI
jgi:hypothetical protein